MIRFRCQWCSTEVEVASKYAGQRRQCGECDALLLVPEVPEKPKTTGSSPPKKSKSAKSKPRRKASSKNAKATNPDSQESIPTQLATHAESSGDGNESKLRIACVECGVRLRLPKTLIGKKVKCASCGHRFIVMDAPQEGSSDEVSADELAPPEDLDSVPLVEEAPEIKSPRRSAKLSLKKLFRRTKEEKKELPSFLKELRAISASLPSTGFELWDLMLTDTRGDKLPVVGEHESGDGIHALGLILMICFQTRATDIHVEPKEGEYEIRTRVDGLMVPLIHLPQETGARLVGVVKVLCEIDITNRNIVQEGHFASGTTKRRTDYRVSFTPSIHGQKLAIRVLDLSNTPKFIDDLDLPPWMTADLKRVSEQNSGMVLVCGPTGSGKTTTLYSLIRGIDVEQRNVITIEDPVEYQIDGVTQIPIDESHGKSFTGMLRAVLRQDPDVLLLGEVRDAESAQIVMQAAITGHLVLSTIHAKDTISTIFRLLDLGAEPFLIASALNIVLAQRLVRVLCPYCKRSSTPRTVHLRQMGRFFDNTKVHYPVGCEHCLNTGYKGRRAIFELLTTTEELRDVILKSPTMQELRRSVQTTLFSGLRSNGYRLVSDGVTSLDEIERVVGAE